MGLGSDTAAKLAEMVNKNPNSRKRWMRVEVLIVDEISMVDGAFFDKLEHVARSVRKCSKPFGGIQVCERA